jgi:hypothetical protein
MRPIVKIVLPLAMVLGVATAVAVADPIPPTTPYPAPAADAPACEAKRLAVQEAQADYKFAKDMYALEKEVFDSGTGTPAALWAAEKELHLAAIALNEAKYAEVACRNEKGNAANKVCVGLALQLNKLIDELPMRKALEAGAKAEYNRLLKARAVGAEGKRALAAALRDAEKAEATTKRIEQEIADLRDAIKKNPACAKFDPERPVAKPPAPPNPAPTSAPTQPTDVPTSTPTDPTSAPTQPTDLPTSVLPSGQRVNP